MRIYPNPASERVTIGLTESALDMESLHVYDLLGREHPLEYIRNTASTITLNCSNLEAGYYFMQFRSKDGVSHRGIFMKQ
jgi:hypothetical protein